MGETFYSFLVEIFTNPTNQHLGADRVVSDTLSNIGVFVAYMWITLGLLWFTTKSVLIRRMVLVYLFAAFIGLCGIGHLGHIVPFPLWFTLSLEFVHTVVSFATAFLLWQRRHFIMSVVYQFKYVIGLLKTLDRLDEVDPPE